jgi:FMN-dependent NADH-azoreductase
VVAGVTFKYGASGVEGLAGDKRVILVAARGNFYGEGSPASAFEHLETYLRRVFGFIGVTKLEVVALDVLATGPDARANAMERAAAAARELQPA